MNPLNLPFPPLTARAVEVLILMHRHAGTEEGELVYERGAGGWLGLEKIAPRTVFALLRHCVISPLGGELSSGRGHEVERYVINETGRKLLEEPGRGT